MSNGAEAAITVLLFVVIVLLAYAWTQQQRVSLWRDAYAGEVARNQARDGAIESLRAAHRELQHAFLAQGKELTIALAKAAAAERAR